MIEKTFKKALNFIFLPALLLTFFLTCSSALFYLAQEKILAKPINPMDFFIIETWEVIPRFIVLIVLLLTLKYQSFEKVVKEILLINILFIALFAASIIFPVKAQGHFQTSLYTIVSSMLSLHFCLPLVWGFINRFTTKNEAIKYYLPLTFIIGLVSILISHLIFLNFRGTSLISLVILALGSMICSLILFDWSWKRMPEEEMADSFL